MKETILLNSAWAIKKIAPTQKIDPLQIGENDWLEAKTFPAQIHDILLEHELLPKEFLDGWCAGAIWTDDFDWLYRCSFSGKESGAQALARLVFQGLDTIADIYLNGKLIASHNDFYISETVDVSGLIKNDNTLLLHFHNVKDALAGMELKKEWRGNMQKCKLIRKPIHDFPPDDPRGADYQGSDPWFSPLGIYRDVLLVYPDNAEIGESDLRAKLADGGKGIISFKANINVDKKDAEFELRLTAKDDEGKEVSASSICKGETASLQLEVDHPHLWQPRGFGEPSLYHIEVAVYQTGKLVDSLKKQVGFRRVENPSSMEFLVNGKQVRLWGGSMDPIQGYTHCYQADFMDRVFLMIENANMNMLRIWGEGHPLPDSFYEEADRRGILIWQEFFMGWGAFPDNSEYRNACTAEARELILRIRHHASLLMWCGGNETIMASEHDGTLVNGDTILMKDFPNLLAELDPERYYHPSSPSGGAWANDPREGDYHTYNCVIEYPYGDYPNFMSECIRTAPPVLHSLRRFVKGDLWPAAYDGKFRHEDTFPFPENWVARTHHAAKGHIKTGPYWEYYDADNPEQLIYRFAQSYAKDLRRELEHVRMGSPNGNVPQAKRSKGYCACKLLDTWPKIYCAIIDYYKEGFIPYYATLRGLRSLLLCFDKKDSIRLWFCNDSANNFSGKVKLRLFSLESETFFASESFSVTMKQGEAGIVRDLAEFKYFFPKETILSAELLDDAGNVISDSIEYVTQERRLKFPDATISAKIDGDEIILRSDHFARCVEILGENNAEPSDLHALGWLFSDNYFDLFPGEEKRIKVIAHAKMGTKITIKAHYASKQTVLAYGTW
jgi:hypothetical protein